MVVCERCLIISWRSLFVDMSVLLASHTHWWERLMSSMQKGIIHELIFSHVPVLQCILEKLYVQGFLLSLSCCKFGLRAKYSWFFSNKHIQTKKWFGPKFKRFVINKFTLHINEICSVTLVTPESCLSCFPIVCMTTGHLFLLWPSISRSQFYLRNIRVHRVYAYSVWAPFCSCYCL